MAVANMMTSTVKQNSGVRRVRGMHLQRVGFLRIPWLFIRRSDVLGSFLQSIRVSYDSIHGLSAVPAHDPRSVRGPMRLVLPPFGHISSGLGEVDVIDHCIHHILKVGVRKHFPAFPFLTLIKILPGVLMDFSKEVNHQRLIDSAF